MSAARKPAQAEFPWAFPSAKRNPPVHVARVGNVRVPVYRYPDGRYCVAWRQIAGAPRKRETFPTKNAAVTRAEEIAIAIANSLADVVTLTSADRDNYRRAVHALTPLGIPLHAAIAEYVAARDTIGAHTLMEAAKFFVRGQVERLECPATEAIITELLGEMADDRRDAYYISRTKRDLLRFAAAFPGLAHASEEDVRGYLRNLTAHTGSRKGEPVSARRRDNVRDAIVRLMRFARKKQYLPDKTSAAERIPKQREGSDVCTFTPPQLADVLQHFAASDSDWLPWAAIAAFAGLRTSEIFRLEWSAIRWEAGTIAVRRTVARKVRLARQAPLTEALQAWLAPWREARGHVIPRKWKHLEDGHETALKRLRSALNLDTWPTNVLRHSFGSHRLAIVKSYAQVALEMGNSPGQVRQHYNDPKTEKDAERYFAIFPAESATNIIPIAQGG
jgi:integrase